MDTDSIDRMIRRRLGDKYSRHSTRVGAAVDAIANGASLAAIMQAGGWKSETMVLRYCEALMTKGSAAANTAKMQGR